MKLYMVMCSTDWSEVKNGKEEEPLVTFHTNIKDAMEEALGDSIQKEPKEKVRIIEVTVDGVYKCEVKTTLTKVPFKDK